MKKIIVTGGLGFIGSNLIELLIDKGFFVINIDKISYASNFYNLKDIADNQNYTFLKNDLSNEIKLKKIINKFNPDCIFNLAAETHVDRSIENPRDFVFSNIISTFNLLNSLNDHLRKKPKFKFIHISTDEVYGSTEQIVDVNLLNPANPYSASKAAADMIVSAYKTMHPEITITTLRSNNIAGPGQFINNIIPRFSVLGLLKKKFTLHGDGSAMRRYLWVKDAAEAIWLLAEKATKSQIYHIGHEDKFSNLEIAEKIGTYLGLKDYISFEKDRLINDTIYPADSLDMLRDFHWQPTRDLDDFLPETIEWYREHLEHFRHRI